MPVDVGADIKAKCGKCKQNTWHVVVAKTSGVIAKVQCKACQAQHRYRPPAGAAPTRPTTTRRRSPSAPRRKTAAQPEPPGPSVEADLSRPIRPYSPREDFAVGERVDHVKFGIGVVEDIDGGGKITVCFADQRRVLAMARSAPTLQRPENRTFDT
jgi:hypothetical protein